MAKGQNLEVTLGVRAAIVANRDRGSEEALAIGAASDVAPQVEEVVKPGTPPSAAVFNTTRPSLCALQRNFNIR